jgi:hypothetical protein
MRKFAVLSGIVLVAGFFAIRNWREQAGNLVEDEAFRTRLVELFESQIEVDRERSADSETFERLRAAASDLSAVPGLNVSPYPRRLKRKGSIDEFRRILGRSGTTTRVGRLWSTTVTKPSVRLLVVVGFADEGCLILGVGGGDDEWWEERVCADSADWRFERTIEARLHG